LDTYPSPNIEVGSRVCFEGYVYECTDPLCNVPDVHFNDFPPLATIDSDEDPGIFETFIFFLTPNSVFLDLEDKSGIPFKHVSDGQTPYFKRIAALPEDENPEVIEDCIAWTLGYIF